MPSDSLDIFYSNKFEKYLQRPVEFRYMAYKQFYRECYYKSEKKYPAEYIAVDAEEDGSDADANEPTEAEDHRGSIVPANTSQVSYAGMDDSEEIRSFIRGTRTPRYYDMAGRIVRKRVGKEAIAYFANHSPYGEQVEEYCLAQMLEKLPVTEEEHVDENGTVISHRFASLK